LPYSLNNIYQIFENEIQELNKLVTLLGAMPESIERDTHIEGCFIRMVVSWECFVEEYFLRCMCKAKTRTGTFIKPHGSNSRNVNDAFKKINKHRRDRDKDFTDWLDAKLVQQRIDDNFRKNSRVQKICEAPDRLFELRIIRNAIAHRSTSAVAKFQKYVKEQMGYLATINPTMASLLIQKKRNTNDFIFTLLSNYFVGLALRLTN
jgi:hypothetical protein